MQSGGLGEPGEFRERAFLEAPAGLGSVAVLCLTEWLHLQGPETPEGDTVTLASDGTVDIYSETAEIWVDLPLPVIYDIIAEGRPISKTKSWVVTRLVKKAQLV